MRTTIAAAAFLLLTLPALAAERVENRFDAAVARGAVRRVVVDVSAGDIVIRNGPADRIVASGVASREPDGPRSREKEQRIVNDTSVVIEVRGDEAIVRPRFGPNARGWRAQSFTNYRVALQVPAGLHLDVKAKAGEVEIDGSFGDVNVELTAGEIDVRLPRADVRELRASCRIGEVRTNIGNEVIEREGIFPGRTRYLNPDGRTFVNVHTTVGEVRVELR